MTRCSARSAAVSARQRMRAIGRAGQELSLRDLLTKVIFAEAGWVSRDMGAVRRAPSFATGGLR